MSSALPLPSVRGFKRKKTKKMPKFAKRSKLNTFLNKAVPYESKTAVEKKAVDLARFNYGLNTTTSVVLLNGLTIGANAYQRIGRKVLNKSIHVRGDVSWFQAGSAATDFMRILLVYDKQSDGAAPTFAQVIQSVAAGGGTASGAAEFFNLDNVDRFVVLRDFKYKVDTGGAGSTLVQTGGAQTECKWIIDEHVKADLPTIYSATSNAGTVADILSGGIFLLGSGLLTAANASYQYNVSTRVRFVDM